MSQPAVAAALAIALLGAAAVQAAPPPELDVLLDRAPIVALGRCAAVESSWNREHTLITTTATVEIDRVIRGPWLAGSIRVEQIGGTVGRITQALLGAPDFAVGERSLLLLAPAGRPGAYRVYGLERGKHRVFRDPASGVDRVQLTAGASIRRPGEDPAPPAERVPALSGELPLAVVVDAIERRGPAAR